MTLRSAAARPPPAHARALPSPTPPPSTPLYGRRWICHSSSRMCTTYRRCPRGAPRQRNPPIRPAGRCGAGQALAGTLCKVPPPAGAPVCRRPVPPSPPSLSCPPASQALRSSRRCRPCCWRARSRAWAAAWGWRVRACSTCGRSRCTFWIRTPGRWVFVSEGRAGAGRTCKCTRQQPGGGWPKPGRPQARGTRRGAAAPPAVSDSRTRALPGPHTAPAGLPATIKQELLLIDRPFRCGGALCQPLEMSVSRGGQPLGSVVEDFDNYASM